MFRAFFKKANKLKEDIFMLDYEEVPQEERFFNEIYGYSDLKQLLSKMIVSKESVHTVLVGPPASGKTMFLLAVVLANIGDNIAYRHGLHFRCQEVYPYRNQKKV